jgi:hypothetical protein
MPAKTDKAHDFLRVSIYLPVISQESLPFFTFVTASPRFSTRKNAGGIDRPGVFRYCSFGLSGRLEREPHAQAR